MWISVASRRYRSQRLWHHPQSSKYRSCIRCWNVDGVSRPPDMPCLLLPSQECRFYPAMPDRASRNSSRAFSGGFEVGLRERSSVRYSRRSHRQTTESAELCSPIGCSLWQTWPHHSCVKEASLASGEEASDLQNSATNVPRFERACTYLHRRHASPPPTSANVTISQQQWPQVPSTSSRYGDRSFAVSAPRLWNAFPCELKIATSLISFKRLLKTHLFRMAYEQ